LIPGKEYGNVLSRPPTVRVSEPETTLNAGE
jgi:hypothetical protein